MSNSSRPPMTGRDVAPVGAWLLAVNLGWASPVNLGWASFPMGTRFVAKRFHDV
jgi:hypothetical protein